MSLYQDPVAFEEAIISACDSHERKNERVEGYRRCIPFNGYFVKFGDYSSLNPARLTQEHLAGLAKADKRAPHVPEIYHFFHRDERMAYVVMENIQTVEVSTPDLVAKTAEAVLWMRSVAAPPSVVLGPLGRGRARHAVFKDFEAPLHFTSVRALERYLNVAVSKLPRASRSRDTTTVISIADEPLVLTQSDMDASNFGVDSEGRSCIFDPDEIGWLPESLADYTLLSTTVFAASVAAQLGLQRSPKLGLLGELRGFLWMVAPANLGLDEEGVPKARNA